jgi:calmodulin
VANSGAIVDFESFQKVLNRPGGFRDPGEPEEYCRGFQVFDKDMTGFIGVGQLRYSMTANQVKTLWSTEANA